MSFFLYCFGVEAFFFFFKEKQVKTQTICIGDLENVFSYVAEPPFKSKLWSRHLHVNHWQTLAPAEISWPLVSIESWVMIKNIMHSTTFPIMQLDSNFNKNPPCHSLYQDCNTTRNMVTSWGLLSYSGSKSGSHLMMSSPQWCRALYSPL